MNLPRPANTNIPAAGAGDSYTPEMGGRADPRVLFHLQVGHGGYSVKWDADRHDEALAAFKRLRVKPKWMDKYPSAITGKMKCSCCVTWLSGNKLSDLGVTEILLD